VYVKLHKDASTNETGTTNAAANTTRAAVTFGASSSGTVTSDSDATWTNVSTTEVYYAISLWDAQTNGTGNCLWTGDLTQSKSVTAGDTFTIPSGSLTVSLD